MGVLPFVIYPVDCVDYAPTTALMHLLLGPDGGSTRQNAVDWVSVLHTTRRHLLLAAITSDGTDDVFASDNLC